MQQLIGNRTKGTDAAMPIRPIRLIGPILTPTAAYNCGMSTDRYTRWRLILGKAGNDGLCQMAGRSGLLHGDQAKLHEALGPIYGRADHDSSRPHSAALR